MNFLVRGEITVSCLVKSFNFASWQFYCLELGYGGRFRNIVLFVIKFYSPVSLCWYAVFYTVYPVIFSFLATLQFIAFSPLTVFAVFVHLKGFFGGCWETC